MMKPTLLALLILGAAATGPFAQDTSSPTTDSDVPVAADDGPPSPGSPDRRRGMGTRGDRQAERLAAMDADKDGRVTEAEILAVLEARAGERAQMMIASFDADGDGAIAADEMHPSRERLAALRSTQEFARADTDDDGAISVEEYAQSGEWRSEGTHRRAEHGPGRGERGWVGKHGERSNPRR